MDKSFLKAKTRKHRKNDGWYFSGIGLLQMQGGGGGEGSQKAFTSRMKERGYKVIHRETGAKFQGIGLMADGS